MNNDTSTVDLGLSDYAERSHDEGVGSMETRIEFEQASTIFRKNDPRNATDRHHPLDYYETVLNASATVTDYLATALSEATGKTRAEIYADLRTHITEHTSDRS